MGSEMIWTYALLVEDSRRASEPQGIRFWRRFLYIQRWLTSDSEGDHGVSGSRPLAISPRSLAGVGDTASTHRGPDTAFTRAVKEGHCLPQNWEETESSL
jgi:hypothetical protein